MHVSMYVHISLPSLPPYIFPFPNHSLPSIAEVKYEINDYHLH